MNEENLNLIKEEFDKDRKLWTDIVLQRTFYYGDLKIKIAEREFQFTLFLTTISVAFLALILPLILDSGYKISNIAILGFLISSAVGFARIILSIIFDKKQIPKDEEFELAYFKKGQELAAEIYSDTLNRTVDNEKIKEYSNLGKNAKDLAFRREKEKCLSNKILSIIYYIFLFSFMVGFISLFYGIIHCLWYFQ